MAKAKARSEKDYVALAKKRIVRPSQRTRRPKVLVYARNKKGKTFFSVSAGVDITLVADPEKGTDTMKKLDPQVWHLDQWEELDPLYKFLRTGQHDYQWVSLDGVTKIHSMALNYVRRQAEERDLDRRPGTTTQRDYGRAGELMKQLFANFHTLDMGVIYTAQERMITMDDDEEEGSAQVLYVPDLPQGVRGSLNSLVDVIGRLYVVRVKVKVKGGKVKDKNQRRLWIGPHERYDTGYRADFELPPFIKNPTIPKLEALLLRGEEG